MPSGKVITFEPGYIIAVHTKEGYRLEGLLLSTTDSQVVIYPGKLREWRRKIKYRPVYYHFAKIQKIRFTKTSTLLVKYPDSDRDPEFIEVAGNMKAFQQFRRSLLP